MLLGGGAARCLWCTYSLLLMPGKGWGKGGKGWGGLRRRRTYAARGEPGSKKGRAPQTRMFLSFVVLFAFFWLLHNWEARATGQRETLPQEHKSRALSGARLYDFGREGRLVRLSIPPQTHLFHAHWRLCNMPVKAWHGCVGTVDVWV